MLDTEGTIQVASFENRVFGEHARREPRSTYLYPLWPALAILVPSLLPPLLWLQYTLAPIKAINPGVRHAFDYEYIETIGWSLALSAVLLSLLNLLLLARRISVARRMLRRSDLVARVMTGWQPDSPDAPFLALLREIEQGMQTDSGRDLALQLRLVFQQLSFMQGREKQRWLPSILMLPLLAALLVAIVLNAPVNFYSFLNYAAIEACLLLATHVCLHAFLAQRCEALLLREHLRDLDKQASSVSQRPAAVEVLHG